VSDANCGSVAGIDRAVNHFALRNRERLPRQLHVEAMIASARQGGFWKRVQPITP
jgi:hypothetical protein